MRAVVCTAYGSPEVLQLQEIRKPKPKDDEILIRVHATTVTAGDVELRAFKLPWFVAIPMRLFLGVSKPRKGVLGQELSGVVEAVGANVTRFKMGDPVFAAAGVYMGAHAEYACPKRRRTAQLSASNPPI